MSRGRSRDLDGAPVANASAVTPDVGAAGLYVASCGRLHSVAIVVSRTDAAARECGARDWDATAFDVGALSEEAFVLAIPAGSDGFSVSFSTFSACYGGGPAFVRRLRAGAWHNRDIGDGKNKQRPYPRGALLWVSILILILWVRLRWGRAR